MISIDKALSIMRRIIRYNLNERQYDREKINNAHGRILCETVYSECNVPAFRVSAKHGFAVLASDGKGIRIVLNGTTVSCDIRRLYSSNELERYKTKDFFRSPLQYLSNLEHACG